MRCGHRKKNGELCKRKSFSSCYQHARECKEEEEEKKLNVRYEFSRVIASRFYDHWGRLNVQLKDDKEWFRVGDIEAIDEEKKGKDVYIASVKIKKAYRGMKLCKGFVKNMLQKLLSDGYVHIWIKNASLTLGGIPACFCYVRAAEELGLIVKNRGKKIQSKTMCPEGLNGEIYDFWVSEEAEAVQEARKKEEKEKKLLARRGERPKRPERPERKSIVAVAKKE